jgi:hypothetical protein
MRLARDEKWRAPGTVDWDECSGKTAYSDRARKCAYIILGQRHVFRTTLRRTEVLRYPDTSGHLTNGGEWVWEP